MVSSGHAADEITEEITASNLQELRRGTVVLACLLALREPSYGYALLDYLAERGMPVDANTLYPLLRRLEKQGLLTSEWNTEETRPRKFYSTSGAGIALARVLADDWRRLDTVIGELSRDARTAQSDPGTPGHQGARP